MALPKGALRYLIVAAGLGTIAHALPAPDPVAEAHPEITPFRVPQIPTKTLDRRNILSDIENGVGSILSGLGSDIPSYVASGRSSCEIVDQCSAV
jgi:hypothetical protein